MAKDDSSAPPSAGDEPDPRGALAFVHDRGALARRFLLAELLAPPLALRHRRAAKRGPGQPPGKAPGDRRGR